MRNIIYIYMLLLVSSVQAQNKSKTSNQSDFDPYNIKLEPKLKLVSNSDTSSYRGLSVVNDRIAWVSGTHGKVGITYDGGETWKFNTVKNHEKFDFRDIEAFDSLNAVIMGAGSPAHFLKTTDGGKTWKVTYTNERSEIFFDGMDFWDQNHGIAFSDPVDSKIFIIETNNGGQTWIPLPNYILPTVLDSEAGFAASGSSIQCLPKGYVVIGTGGKKAHLYIGSNYGKNWTRKSTPISQGKPSAGIFSLYFSNNESGIIVGGDYLEDKNSTDNCFITTNSGTFWKKTNANPYGYKSSIEQLDVKTYIATGTKGTDISIDKGLTWKVFSNEGFNVVSKAKFGDKIILVGSKGKIGILVLE
ncbi:MAG: YCF48-related protein [Bacteroidota bacterium]|jgi:photosystem II stability/assembly factor-like uncharacterized protein